MDLGKANQQQDRMGLTDRLRALSSAEGDHNPRQRWHVSKEISIAIIFALFGQTIGLVWGAANMYAKLDEVARTVVEIKADRYTQSDARRDFMLRDQRDAELERRITSIESRGYQGRGAQ